MNPNCILCNSETELYYQWREKSFYQCKSCFSITLSPQHYVDFSDEKSRYEEHDNDVNDPRYQKFVSKLVEAVMQHHTSEESGLDFGAGTGPVISKMLEDKGYHMKLYDPFFWNQSENLKQQYDFIVCCETMEHFHKPMEEFTLLKSLLKPGGSLFCKTYIHSEVLDFGSWSYKNDPTHVIFYQDITIEWLASALNMDLLHCEYSYIHFRLPGN